MPKAKSTEAKVKAKYCPQCGREQTANAKFCGNCGHNLAGVEKTDHAISHIQQAPKTHPAVWVLIAIVIAFVIIGVISILASIVIVAINPTKQIGDARNAQRRSDTNTILNAVYQYAIDNNGDLPTTLPTTPREICQYEAYDCAGLVDLSPLVGDYLVDIPSDPATNDPRSTEYTIEYDSAGRVTVAAPHAEGEEEIYVRR